MFWRTSTEVLRQSPMLMGIRRSKRGYISRITFYSVMYYYGLLGRKARKGK